MDDKKCEDCGKRMNPLQALMGDVCSDCIKKRHKDAVNKLSGKQ